MHFGVTVVGALLSQASQQDSAPCLAHGSLTAMINVAGGFVVTHRMLEMFNPKKK